MLFIVYTNYSCGGHLDDVTWIIYANFCALMPKNMSLIGSVACEKMFYVKYLFGGFFSVLNTPKHQYCGV